MTVQGERTGVGARKEDGTAKVGTVIFLEAHGGGRNGRERKGSSELARSLVQVAVPAESRTDVSAHSFWKRGTIPMFGIRIGDFNAVSYLQMAPENPLAKVEKKKKYSYLQDFLEQRHYFTPNVYYADRIPVAEVLAAQRILATLLSYMLKQ